MSDLIEVFSGDLTQRSAELLFILSVIGGALAAVASHLIDNR